MTESEKYFEEKCKSEEVLETEEHTLSDFLDYVAVMEKTEVTPKENAGERIWNYIRDRL